VPRGPQRPRSQSPCAGIAGICNTATTCCHGAALATASSGMAVSTRRPKRRATFHPAHQPCSTPGFREGPRTAVGLVKTAEDVIDPRHHDRLTFRDLEDTQGSITQDRDQKSSLQTGDRDGGLELNKTICVTVRPAVTIERVSFQRARSLKNRSVPTNLAKLTEQLDCPTNQDSIAAHHRRGGAITSGQRCRSHEGFNTSLSRTVIKAAGALTSRINSEPR